MTLGQRPNTINRTIDKTILKIIGVRIGKLNPNCQLHNINRGFQKLENSEMIVLNANQHSFALIVSQTIQNSFHFCWFLFVRFVRFVVKTLLLLLNSLL